MNFMGYSIGAINMKNIYNDTLSKINQRQRQIIVHSVIYYKFNTNLVTDEVWQGWANELVKLQKDYKELSKKSAFWRTMEDFDGSTGFHLADNVWGINKAQQLLNYRDAPINPIVARELTKKYLDSYIVNEEGI